MNAFLHNFETVERLKHLLGGANERSLEQFGSFLGENTSLIQLSPGRFSGTVLSAELPHASVQLERCNQDIEKEVWLGEDELSFTTCMVSETNDVSCDGTTRERDRVLVQAPGCRNVSILPSGSIFLTIKVRKCAFLGHQVLCPEVNDWLLRPDGKIEFLRSDLFARRLNDVGCTVLEVSASANTPVDIESIEQNLVLSILNTLTLEWLSKQSFATYPKPHAFHRFQMARDVLLQSHGDISDPWTFDLDRLGSRRTIEQAFSKLINMGPAAYARVMRLNIARRKILDRANTEKNIGDIAAEEGFWDWSRFTTYYRKQFGELPSVTRSELLLSKGYQKPLAT